jgi:branched-chain amino acid transport system permease protein
MRLETLAILGGVAASVLAPPFVSDFWVFVAIEMLVFALYAMSFNLLFGYGGMLAFGHAVFFGVGAYATAILMRKVGMSPIPAVLVSPLLAAAAGAVIGFFCVRLSGIYLGMLTFAFQMLAYTVVLKSYDFTGGDDGITGFGPSGAAANPLVLYYLVLLVVGLALFVLWRAVNSPFGLALMSVRDNAPRSAALGINVRLHRILAFTAAAGFAGLAGSLFALANHSVFPGWINWTASATPIVITILGGMNNFLGPVVGAAIYVLLQTWLTGVTEYWALFLGCVILLIVTFLPNGVTGMLRRKQ